MTLYLIGGAVLFVAGVFIYAYRQGKRIANLDTLINSNELSNEAKEKIKEIDAKFKKTVSGIDRDRVVNFWLRGNKSKKP
jgi:hypothetical protein|tara:strand:- start:475 stop:714 length:240 start_codon:yes stop_codon:yes gene_type:complete